MGCPLAALREASTSTVPQPAADQTLGGARVFAPVGQAFILQPPGPELELEPEPDPAAGKPQVLQPPPPPPHLPLPQHTSPHPRTRTHNELRIWCCGAASRRANAWRLGQAQPLASSGWSGSAAARLMGGTGLCAICGAALAGCGCGRLRFEHVASPEPQGEPAAE
jgi:hypothetical protein